MDLMIDPAVLDRFERLGVALAIGLLMGVERGWKEREAPAGSRTAGVRTFALVGLLGGVLAMLGQELGGVVTALGFAAFAAVILVFEFRSARLDDQVDATPAVAALVALALGALAGAGFLRAAAAAGVAATLLLALKHGLHRWLEKVTFEELRAALLLAAMTVILLPLLPDRPIDPWGGLNPRAVWLMTILIAAVSFVGYAAIRIAGPGRGPVIGGLAGGLVSSTATTVSFSRRAKEQGDTAGGLLAGVVAANAVMFARVAIIASALRPQLIEPLAVTLGPAALVSAVASGVLALRARRSAREADSEADLTLRNPLDLPLALQFGALLAAVSLAAALVEALVGAHGVFALAAVSGLVDVDAMMLAMAGEGGPAAQVAVVGILIAVAANTVSKAVLSWIAGGRGTAQAFSAASALALAAMGAGWVLWSGLL